MTPSEPLLTGERKRLPLTGELTPGLTGERNSPGAEPKTHSFFSLERDLNLRSLKNSKWWMKCLKIQLTRSHSKFFAGKMTLLLPLPTPNPSAFWCLDQ